MGSGAGAPSPAAAVGSASVLGLSWYWLADLCAEEKIPFVLGHALYMKAIHGGKSGNDRIDSRKIAGLMRGGLLAQAYVYPRGMRSTRDLLRRRTRFVRQRASPCRFFLAAILLLNGSRLHWLLVFLTWDSSCA